MYNLCIHISITCVLFLNVDESILLSYNMQYEHIMTLLYDISFITVVFWVKHGTNNHKPNQIDLLSHDHMIRFID